MRIKTFGAKHFTGQLPRIEEGFRALGHEIVEENSDLVYCNNFPYSEALKEKGFKIFTLLDVPIHCWNESDYAKCNEQLHQADAVCAISETVRKQIKGFFKLDAITIYQPVMEIFLTTHFPDLGEADYKYLIVGRAADSNKRNTLVFKYLQQYDPKAKVAIVGSESPGFGDWFGVLPVDILNQFYNSCQYVFCGGKIEGIQLPLIEKLIVGNGFPIAMNDCEAALEFASEFCCSPDIESINKKIIEIEENPAKYREIVKAKQADFKIKFDKVEVARKILGLINETE